MVEMIHSLFRMAPTRHENGMQILAIECYLKHKVFSVRVSTPALYVD